MKEDNIQMLNDTLAICKQGYYFRDGKQVSLKLSREEMESSLVFLPDELEMLKNFKDFPHVFRMGRCGCSCENKDAFTLAREREKDRWLFDPKKKGKEILVLNLANPVHPGGGVRHGARAQEEDLCRKSSLLLSLESPGAKRYYDYNYQLYSHMASNAIIITPKVEIIKDEKGQLLEEPVVVAVMSCAAPMVTKGLEGMSHEAYKTLLYERISGMLRCAAYLGYEVLVLGAFGCGAFGNDARVVSDVFYKAMKEFRFDGMSEKDMFWSISFAVLSRDPQQYNYKEFYRNFGGGNYYREEDAEVVRKVQENIKAREVYLDKIRGSLIGGAVGDALGYPVEFMSYEEIRERYGPAGITSYWLDKKTGKALISDDTQMTLFTANGILFGETRGCMRGIGGPPSSYVSGAYQDWLTTQQVSFSVGKNQSRYWGKGGYSWLLDVPELYSCRAPGNTCLSALWADRQGKILNNNSKGCGGVMRVAPLGLHFQYKIEDMDKEGAALAAITHGHPLGYLPAAVLTHILNRIVYPVREDASLKELILEALDTVCEQFRETAYLQELREITEKAISLAENNDLDIVNIRKLGEGWVAEEALAIALYCSLRYTHDFSAGIIAAVNHDGDSDSTGAITGNILGAINGYSRIHPRWKKDLELMDVLLEMADDLCHGCQMSEYGTYRDPVWERKYMEIYWKEEAPVFFWLPNKENGCFSNAYESPFVVDGVYYQHVEQYLMAGKAKLFGDMERCREILGTQDPKLCKYLGRKVNPFHSKTWDKEKYRILAEGVRAKFSQNPNLKEALLATGNAPLAKASPQDDIWGIGLSAEEARNMEPDQWPGENLLGHALMAIRIELRESP